MKKILQGLSICNVCDTLDVFRLEKGFVKGLIMRINTFFIDQLFFEVYLSTEVFMSVRDD